MDCSMPGLPVPHHLLEFAQVHVHSISDAIQPSHPLMPSSPLALNLFHENTGLIFPLGRCGNKASKRLNNLLRVIELTITVTCTQSQVSSLLFAPDFSLG